MRFWFWIRIKVTIQYVTTIFIPVRAIALSFRARITLMEYYLSLSKCSLFNFTTGQMSSRQLSFT